MEDGRDSAGNWNKVQCCMNDLAGRLNETPGHAVSVVNYVYAKMDNFSEKAVCVATVHTT